MATYSVNMSNVNTVVEEMSSISTTIKAMLDGLAQDSTVNLAEWTSEARDAYNTCKLSWDNAATAMVNQAVRAHTSLSGINANYGTSEVQGRQMWEV
ncbi:WXG100 family type VII secretion target [Streptomyces sp. DSM 15324]|uniref:WXG100 family type VII secretion target n=1 Tax=Streptomyces sp. DSM 15324 TaxID=1739111 RepID=UPI00074818F3|nr:hypothetical protein [Streptomyces sp. DSM 15324]KUO09351.1 hypothetical protein AQJ58_25485 [Streptomyces sp. DSM 15324]